MTRIARAWAPATIANVGPGFDVLGLAVEHLGITVTIESDGTPVTPGTPQPALGSVYGRDADRIPTDAARNSAVLAARLAFATVSGREAAQDPATLTMDNGLPFAGGLGGSAAAAVAGAAAALAFLGEPAEPKLVMRLALEAEAQVAGRHLDNIAAAVFGGLTIALDTETLDAVRIPVPASWAVALVTPKASIDTKSARALLPESWPLEHWVRQMARTSAVVHAFATGDGALLGRALRDAFAEPVRAPLIPGFESVRRAALDAGAFGCSISGSGPTMFAIADDVRAGTVAVAMAEALGDDLAMVSYGAIAETGVRAS